MEVAVEVLDGDEHVRRELGSGLLFSGAAILPLHLCMLRTMEETSLVSLKFSAFLGE